MKKKVRKRKHLKKKKQNENSKIRRLLNRATKRKAGDSE